MFEFLKKLFSAEQAEALSEYALLLALIVFTAVAAIKGVGGTVDHFFANTSALVSVTSNHQSINTDPMPDDNGINTNNPSNTKEKKPNPIG